MPEPNTSGISPMSARGGITARRRDVRPRRPNPDIDVVESGAGRESAAAIARTIARDAGLSRRETQVLMATARGCCTKQIATTLRLSGKTIEYFWTRIFLKLGCRSQIEAMSLLLEYAAKA